MTSLNPVHTVGNQIIEAIRLHRRMSSRQARGRAIELLELVGIPSPSGASTPFRTRCRAECGSA